MGRSEVTLHREEFIQEYPLYEQLKILIDQLNKNTTVAKMTPEFKALVDTLGIIDSKYPNRVKRVKKKVK